MSDDTSWLTISELADRLGVSASAIRDWRHAGRDQVPSRPGPDGVARYPLAVFERIAMLRRDDVPLARVRDALARDDDGPPATAREDRVLALLEQIAADVRRIAEHLAPDEDG